MNALEMIKLVVATGVASLTITKSRPLRRIRLWVQTHNDWLGELASCPYCMSHWVSAVFVGLYWPGNWREALLQWLFTVAIAAPVSAGVYWLIDTMHSGGTHGQTVD